MQTEAIKELARTIAIAMPDHSEELRAAYDRIQQLEAQCAPNPTAAELLDALLSRIDFDGMDPNTFTIAELRRAI